jgi:glyceraldehyde 3-phosphate dehydrogenase
MSRLAINGMGRIGRTLLRVLHQRNMLARVVAVNDIMPKENLIYLLNYDSIRGAFPAEIKSTQNGFSINGNEIIYLHQSTIDQLNWRTHSVKTVVEATGLFTHSSEATHHLIAGANNVLLTTYSKDISSTILGIHHHQLTDSIVSPGDCTINCVAPIIHTIEKKYGIESVHVNVIQGYTTRQELLDSPYKGLRRGRAAANSIIPFEVNIRPVLETIFPALLGKIETMSTRVPIPCGALADLSIILKNKADATSINKLFQEELHHELKNIISITFEPIVSVDVLGNPHSSVIDGTLTKVTNGTHVKLLAWFDNEWGYANRLADWVEKM